MDPREHEDDVEALVQRAQAGDRAALGAIYDRLADRVYRYALFRVGSRSDAEDLMQRTFLKMIESLPRYQHRGIPFEAWFFRLARNGVIDHLRTRRGHRPLDEAFDILSPGPSPEDSAEVAVQLARLDAALRELSLAQQEVIGYRFMAGLSPREIGLVIGKREGSVRALQFRALQALRSTLGRHAAHPQAGDPGIRREPEGET
jgi:RNA polymerase sigma-70 factor (ECF subfamily)